jgi:GntR family transcriptional regulator/MocR family aminotransferase
VAVQWSGLGPGVLLAIERQSGQSLRSQLADGLRDAIRIGRLRTGERLPSSRELARELGVSRGLVQECYEQLQAEGYLISQVGSATRVASNAHPVPDPPMLEPVPPTRLIADFRSGTPDLASFPRTDWAWATREACRTAATADLDYGDPRGLAELRDVLAAYLRRVRAAAADPARIVVCTGYTQGLGLVARTLRRFGARAVAFEDPGYGDVDASESIRAARAAGLRTVHVPVDEHGLDVQALAASGADAVVVTAAHQSPTGVVLAPQRRHALVEWADRNNAYVIEDDYDSEFRYDREPVGVVQGLAPDHVFLIGTTSKALAPAVRLGWILAPLGLAEAVREEKLISDRGSSGLDQLAVATLLKSGRYDRHLRRMRVTYGRRRDALGTALAQHAAHIKLTGLAAGFHAVAHLPAGADERAVVRAAAQRSVGLYGMSQFRADGAPTPPQLVLGFGNLGERAIGTGIATIADLLR